METRSAEKNTESFLANLIGLSLCSVRARGISFSQDAIRLTSKSVVYPSMWNVVEKFHSKIPLDLSPPM